MIGSSSRDFCAKTGPPRSPSTMALATIFFMALNPGKTSPVDSNMAWGSAQCDQIVAQWTVLLGIRLRLTGHFGGFAHVIVAPDSAAFGTGPPRHDWTREQVRALFAAPFPDLMFRAGQVHRENFDSSEVQISTLLSIKTGGCPEDCAYCPQSAKFDTGVKAEKLMDLDAVLAEARAAKAGGASRFCMGAAWRSPKDRDLDKVCEMVEGVKALGMETCVTLGML